MNIIIIAVVFLLMWSLWGIFASRVEQAQYSVVDKKHGYEVREYPAHIVAETTVKGTYEESLSQGFRIVASYIFGANTKKEKVAMTAPVLEQTNGSEKIAMTAPVLASMDGDMHTISFGMPRSYSEISSLPVPNDSRIRLVQIPFKKMAVLRFSWFRTTSRVVSMKEMLLTKLARDGVKILATPVYAGYNAPATPPWLMRHEILVEIE